ncbi:hypothetical protein PUN28_010478 [Cardiocondyla obscurior]|uniref:Uncharacterized protein n=1 Tax=Cardiocondyla obscurior TaxID=286306 RepID=A0AAW2FLT7_9HYME
MPFAFSEVGISLESFEFSADSIRLMGLLLSEVTICCQNLRSIKKSRPRRNRKIRELRELVQTFFVQFLFAAAPREVAPEPPKTRSERSWSPPPTVPPNSPINGDDLESGENTPPRTPSPSRSRSTSSSEPEPELFRPTSPSYTPDRSRRPSPRTPPEDLHSVDGSRPGRGLYNRPRLI